MAAEELAPPEPPPSPGDETMLGFEDPARVFWIVLGVAAALNLVVGLVRKTPLTFFFLVFGPMLLAGVVTLGLLIVRDLRAGRWLQGGFGALMVLTILWVIGSGWLARVMMFPGGANRLPPPGSGPPGLAQLGLRTVDYTTADGIELRGLLAEAKREKNKPPPPVLVYFHGNAETAADNLPIATDLARAGLTTFVGEYRGYGGSSGSPHEAGLMADGRAALAAIERELKVPSSHVVLVGRSLGTGVAAGLAGEGHGRGLVLYSPYTSMVDMARSMVPDPIASLAVRDVFDSLTALGKVEHRVLVVHGTRDEVIPFAQGERLAGSLGDRARLLALEGVHHNDLFAARGREIIEETVRFVRSLP